MFNQLNNLSNPTDTVVNESINHYLHGDNKIFPIIEVQSLHNLGDCIIRLAEKPTEFSYRNPMFN